MADNRIDLFAFLHANRRSVDNTQKDIAAALRQAGRDGSDQMAREIENASPRIRRAIGKVADATSDADRAERKLNKTREDGLKILDRRHRLEGEYGARLQQNLKERAREIELERTLGRERAAADAQTIRTYELEKKVLEQRQKSNALNAHVREKNLGVRDLRLDARGRRQSGDVAGAREIEKRITAEEKNLQPLRKAQAAAAKQLKADEAELGRAREVMAARTLDAKNAESDLNAQRKEVANGARDVERIESELGATREELRRHTEAQTRADEDALRMTRRREEALRSLHEVDRRRTDRRNTNGRGRHPGRRVGGILGNAFTDIPGVPGGPVGAIVGPAVITVLGSVAEAAVTASQALALLPAVAVAGGAGMATLAIGMDGFGKALKDMEDPKKFAKDLALLGPAAQQAALEIQFLSSNDGPLGQLKRQTEENLFKGVPESLHGLANSLSPMLTELTSGIATAFNGMFNSLSQTLQGNGEKATLHAIVQNIVATFQQLEPAIRPFTDAFLRIIQVGSSFLPGISDAIVKMANSFNNFVQKAAADGSFQNFIQKGIDAAASLGNWLLDLGKKIYEVFGNKSPDDFRQMLDNLTNSLAAIGTAIVGIAELVNDILPTLNSVADAVGGWPTLIVLAITAFLGIKTIVAPVITGLIMSLGASGVAGALGALPGAAAAAGSGIVAGLAGAAALIAKMAAGAGTILTLWNSKGSSNSDPTGNPTTNDLLRMGATAKQIEDFQQAQVNGDKATMDRIKREVAGPFNAAPDSPSQLVIDRLPPNPAGGWFGYAADPNAPGKTIPFNAAPDTGIGNTSTYNLLPNAGLGDYHQFDVPAVPPTGGGGHKAIHGPEVPYSGDPMSLLQGYQPTASLYNAAGSVLDKRRKVEQDRADLQALEASNTATADDIQKKKNDLAKDEREQYEAELRLNEAKNSAAKKQLKSLGDTNSAFQEIGAGLDKDLGLSKGLPGLADNLVRFLANLATAPLQGILHQIAKQGDGSYGVIGMMFGGPNKSLANGSYDGSSYGGSLYGSSPRAGGYPGDAALLSNVRPGRYSQDPSRDLLKGLSDCSSSVGDLVNILDTGTTGSGPKLTTGNAAEWLPAHGFVPGMGGPGDFRVGYNGGHMQATLPGGTPWNWGSDAAAARGGVGGTGADDPSFTSHYYRPAGAAAAPVGGLASGGASSGTTPVFVTNWPGGGGLPGPVPPSPTPTPAPGPAPGPTPKAPSTWWAPGSTSASPSLLPPLPPGTPPPPGLSYPGQAPGALPSPAGGPLNTGMPNGLPVPGLGPVTPGSPFGGASAPNLAGGVTPYSAQDTPQAQGGWQPSGGGGLGMGGLAMGAIQAGIAAAGASGAPFGGQAAAAAAQMGIQLLNRTIAYGGQVAGIAAEGLIDTLTPTNPDTGQNPLKDSWLWRAAGALASARPAVGSGGAGDQDKAAQKRMQDEQAKQQGDTNHTYNAPQNMTQNVNIMQGANQSGKSVGQDAAQQLQQAVMLPR